MRKSLYKSKYLLSVFTQFYNEKNLMLSLLTKFLRKDNLSGGASLAEETRARFNTGWIREVKNTGKCGG